jgi:hypothetical protein
MSEESVTKPGTGFWITAGLLAVWNLSGLYQYFLQSRMTADQFEDAGYTIEQVAYIMATPAWAHSGYAIAVNAGVLGVIFLLLRKSWAVPMFILSLIGALVQDVDAYLLREALDLFHAAWLVLPITVIVICTFEIWYSLRAKNKGWLT